MEKIIDVQGLVKSYGKVAALRGVDFYVETGRLFALLGENGAGKSTTVDIMATLLRPNAGTVHISGLRLGPDNDAIRRRIGIVFQQSVLDNLLTVRENLLMRGGLYGLSEKQIRLRIDEIAKPLGIDEFLDRRYQKLSGGQRRRADIARALLHTPAVLFLDEPTTGLDPASRKTIWEMVRAIQTQSGTSVVLTTHYMEEAAAADYVVVLGHGLVLARGTPPHLKEHHARDAFRFEPLHPEQAAARLAADGVAFARQGVAFVVEVPSTFDALPLLERYRPLVKNFEIVKGSMDEAFLHIIRSGGEDGEGGGTA